MVAHALKNPRADKGEVVRRLATLIDKRRIRLRVSARERPMRNFVQAICIAAAACLVGTDPAGAVNIRDHRSPSRGPGAYTLDAPAVFEMSLFRQAGQTTTCETRNLTPRADPVLHVLRFPTGDGLVSELARDDDSAGALNARVTFTAPSTGRYLLVLRAAGPASRGQRTSSATAGWS